MVLHFKLGPRLLKIHDVRFTALGHNHTRSYAVRYQWCHLCEENIMHAINPFQHTTDLQQKTTKHLGLTI